MATSASTSIHATRLTQITAVVFDLDGTLIDSTPGISGALAIAFQSANRSMPAVDLRRVIGPPIGVIARRIEPSLTDTEVATIERSYRNLYDSEGWRNTVAYEAVADTLDLLYRHGLNLFIVTNKPLVPTSNILAQLGLNAMFLEALTRDSRVPHFSSKTEMLADLLSRHHLQPSTTLMIGDTSEDQEAAHATGIDFLHVTYGFGSVDRPARCIHHFSEIASLLSLSANPSTHL